MKKKVILGLLIMLMSIFVYSCGVQASNGQTVENVLIGALYPLSGSQAPTGLEVKNGIEFGTEVINNKYPGLNLPLAADEGIPGLKGAKIQVEFSDTQAIPEKGMSDAERLYTSERPVVAIMGTYNSSVAAPVSLVSEKLHKVFLCPDCTNPSLTKRGLKWFFRLTPHDGTFINNMMLFLKDMEKEKGIKIKTLAIVNENTLWGQDFADLVKEKAKENGYSIVENIVYPAKTTDLTSEVQRLKGANPDVILHASYISDSILFIKTYKEQGYIPKILLANAGGFIEQGYIDATGKDGDYIITRSVWSADIGEKKPVVRKVNELYKQKYGHSMNEYSARGFMGIIVLADVLNRAKTTESEALRKAMLETNIPADQVILAWDGIKFNPKTGQNTLGKALMAQLVGGKMYTVWPFKLAKRDVIYPIPKFEDR